jgi:hypothetical protein
VSAAGANDDASHGIDNEFGATTYRGTHPVGTSSSAWWHDLSYYQCSTAACAQGSDHGSSLRTGTVLGQYAIYITTGDDVATFPCDGQLECSMWL